MNGKFLISGASIAGCTAAWALARAGCEVTLIEKHGEFRDGGQNIDVRGAGREVLKRMQLEDAALQRGTGEEGTAWVEEDGTVAAQFLTKDLQQDGPTAEMEILRGDLARLLFDATSPMADFRFGDTVRAVDQNESGATVHFASGTIERFDAIVVAEGVGSSTRDLVFEGENDPRWMDLTLAYFTIPREPGDDKLWRWYHATDGRSVSLRPDRHGTTRAMLSLQKPPEGEQDWDVDRQKSFLHDRFASAGWQTERVLKGMDVADDFYFDALRQVRLPRWSNQRVVVTGDAAWCATPLAGAGTTLAVTGAYVLAGEIQRADTLVEAFARYEAVMRPIVEDAQSVPKIGPRLMNPHSKLGIALLHAVLGAASHPPLRDIAARLFAKPPKAPDLSRYALQQSVR